MKQEDDFGGNWEEWSKIYQAHTNGGNAGHNTVVLPEGSHLDDKDEIIMPEGLKPLHGNWRNVYQAVAMLKAKSVFEFGFGGGQHLVNLKRLMPHLSIKGIDRANNQRNYAVGRHPELAERIFVWDAAEPLVNDRQSVDVAYSQAVIMHMARHMEALHNMFSVATKHVVLMENWLSHDFVADVLELSKRADFPWEDLHLYKYDSGVQITLVAARKPLKHDKIVPLIGGDQELREAYMLPPKV